MLLKIKVLVGIAAVCGCSSERPSVIAAGESTFAVDDLYAAQPGLKEAMVATYNSIAVLTFPQYYERVLAMTSNDHITINGVEIANVRSTLIANKAAFLAPQVHYRTVGDYWQAMGYSVAEVQPTTPLDALTELQTLAHPTDALALLPSDIVTPLARCLGNNPNLHAIWQKRTGLTLEGLTKYAQTLHDSGHTIAAQLFGADISSYNVDPLDGTSAYKTINTWDTAPIKGQLSVVRDDFPAYYAACFTLEPAADAASDDP